MRHKIALGAMLLGASMPAAAEITARAQASTVGVGMELGYRMNAQWGLRAGYLRGDLDADFQAEDNNGFEGDELQYDSDIDLRNTYVFADWHPWRKRFRITAGVLFNDSEATIVTRCDAESLTPEINTATCEFGNSRFSSAVLGEITTQIGFDQIAPYAGIGWQYVMDFGLGFNADFGVAYIGAADVSMSSSGSCNSNASCRQQIEQEEQEIQDELDDYKLLPTASLGVSFFF